MSDRLIRVTTTIVVLGVAIVAAIVSYEHAYALVRAHGGPDGPLGSYRYTPVPPLALWLLALGIAATLAANVMHRLGHGYHRCRCRGLARHSPGRKLRANADDADPQQFQP